MEFEFEGMDILVQELESMGNESSKYADEAVEKSTIYYQEKVIDRAPKWPEDGGNLKRHIERTDVKNGESDVFVDQQGKAYYGVMVEEGTSKMKAQPYMYTTFHQERNNLMKIMADVLRMRLML